MATIMTPSRFGSSLSGAPPTYPISMADTLPTVDFGFADLRERMQQFTVRFDDFIERGRKRVLEERNAFRLNVAELEDAERARLQSISNLESRSSAHTEALAKEAAETEEMHVAIESLTAQKEAHVTRRDALKADINSVQAAIRQRREAQATHQRALDAQARHNVPELRFWERCLGLRIEATGLEDQLRFVYASSEESGKGSVEGQFELQMGGVEYEVVSVKPKLDRHAVKDVQERLNETRELGVFLKDMRGLFLEAALKT